MPLDALLAALERLRDLTPAEVFLELDRLPAELEDVLVDAGLLAPSWN